MITYGWRFSEIYFLVEFLPDGDVTHFGIIFWCAFLLIRIYQGGYPKVEILNIL